MKKVSYLAVLLIAIVSLAACTQSKTAKTKSTSESSSMSGSSQSTEVSETSSASSSEAKVSSESLYQPIFEDYAKIFSYAATSTSTENEAFFNLLKNLHQPLNEWTASSIARDKGEAVRYAFYDIDKNGTDELLVGKSQQDGMFVDAFYYLQGDTPTLLAQSYVAGVGGGRSSMLIFNDGTILSVGWGSGSGDGTATMYSLQTDNSAASKTSEQEVKIPGTDLLQTFGKTEADKLNLDSLDWKEFEKPAPSTTSSQNMDVSALKSGDTSSIQGTWVNGEGQSVTISPNKLEFSTGATDTYNSIVNYTNNQELLYMDFTSRQQYGDGFILIPAGVDGFGVSDASRDRLVQASRVVQTPNRQAEWFYYRQ